MIPNMRKVARGAKHAKNDRTPYKAPGYPNSRWTDQGSIFVGVEFGSVPLAPREENFGFFCTLECHQRLDTEATSPAPK